MAISLAPLTELRRQIEATAARDDLAPASRVAQLRTMSRRIEELLGRIGTYIGDLELERESHALTQSLDLLQARENARVREELLRRGMTTPEQLDEMGYLSNEELDRLAEEGLLESKLVGLAKKWEEALHPRGKGGKFKQTFGAPEPTAKATPGPAVQPGYQERRKEFERKAGERVTSEVEKTRERLAGGKALTRTGPASSADLSDGEVHINSAGKISQHTLGRYARMALTQPSTLDEHSRVDAEGNRTFSPERQALHQEIIDKYLRRMKFNPELKGGKGDWEFDPEGEYHASVDDPEVVFSGGGYAAGKGTVVKNLEGQGRMPDSGYDGPPLTLDPDKIKAMLPEFFETADEDPEANARVYEEAWMIAQEIQRQAQEQRMNLVVDGISNTSADEMIHRAQEFLDKGYKARAVYVDIPTDEALRRAAERARTAKDMSDKRMIPEVVMRAVHRDVSATVPDLIQRLQDFDLPLAVEVWDNDQGKDSAGGFRPPKRMASYEPGSDLVIEDTNLWERFKAKADEEILGVDMPPDTASMGVTPFRPEFESEGFYHSDEFRDFESKLMASAKEHDITIASKRRAEGVWQGETEPSFEVLAHDGPEGLRAWAEEMRAAHNQDGVLLFTPDDSGSDAAFTLNGVEDTDAAFQAMVDAGLPGGRVQGDVLEIIGPLEIQGQIDQLRAAIGIDDVEFVQGHFEIVERPAGEESS